MVAIKLAPSYAASCLAQLLTTPVAAALIIAVPTVFYLNNGLFGILGPGQTVRTMPMFMYIIMALIGVMFTLVGAYVGERIQMGPPPKPAN